ncbi:hemerythrin domain-containing protein [Actinocrinis puniceicyclus]|uniref:Hemerythrin domain-containing protein n=1 Tax=Actinocrinis puniceicyclus TaxID=977794 RepID=A0A8J7WKL0_9ACTN|nr:hemerythrin domain-containing protein [Actinocrinis puniceicyclus]MBS2961442.1 hemerythrin domain-containing protein [Actinocrinis puniceicyclus]
MKHAERERMEAARLPEGNIVGLLLEQHARIRELFIAVKASTGDQKQRNFDELRELLAVHEVGEEMILRPVSKDTAGKEVTDARNHEEDEATHVLARLEGMDVHSAEFDAEFYRFEQAVSDHAEHEENEEFPTLLAQRTEAELKRLGDRLLRAEKAAPTHPHPSAAGSPAMVKAAGPFAAMLDRARDAVKKSSEDH